MPVVAPAVLTPLAALGGALIGAGAQKRAAKYQADAGSQAMQYQREQAAEDRRRYDQAYARYEQDRANYDAARRAILAKHGYELPAAPNPLAQTRVDPTGAPAAPGGGGAPAPKGLSLGTLAGSPQRNPMAPTMPPGPVPTAAPGPPTAGPVAPGGASLSQMAGNDWDWSKYAPVS